MNMRRTLGVAMAGLLGVLLIGDTATRADEGMWLYNQVPRQLLKEKYGFEPTDAWLDHLRLSSVRFNSGGSGSFVSSNGLVMTNHHVGADALQKLSDAEHDLLATGYFARTPADEKPCVDLELNVLVHIEVVTERVNAAVKPGQSPAEAQEARRAIINTIEQEETEKTDLRSDVVTLYQGGEYHLYQFKKYTDVRLVFAPEQDIAFFGGDPDNFEYPRFDLDICFFRVYEDGKPAKIEHYLKWSEAGAGDGELIFVSGHPGSTSRLNTVAHLEYLRDVQIPDRLNTTRRREVLLQSYSERSLENQRRAKDELFGYQNSRKARIGGLAGLQDPALMARKAEAEASLRAAVAADPELKASYGSAWDDVIATLQVSREIRGELNLIEGGEAFNTVLFGIARTLVRMAAEDSKPNADRLSEYGAAGRESLEQELYSEAPIYPDLEIVKLADSLGMLMEKLGADHPMVVAILAGQSPR
ncbi:MAG: S46 family peptidase, partial [Planctomycetaceae bacterium]|nr:S46 family peptidase [Planctomycetaceae bacterium]